MSTTPPTSKQRAECRGQRAEEGQRYEGEGEGEVSAKKKRKILDLHDYGI
jgi:hypothetical protein